jgi:NitT/TauT family transport system permease protein
MNRLMRVVKQQSQILLAFAVFLLAWEGLCRAFNVPRWLLPPPSEVAAQTWEIRNILPEHILATALAVGGGFLLSIAAGVPLAIAVVASPLLRRLIYPILLMLQSVPKVAIAPILLLWVGYGLASNIVVAAAVAFFPIVINTAAGLEAVDAELLELTTSLNASKIKVFLKVRLPWALPQFFSGMKIAITLAVVGAIVAEFIGADKGLGYLILTNSGAMRTSVMFGVLVLLSLLGTLSFYFIVLLERILCPWYLPQSQTLGQL